MTYVIIGKPNCKHCDRAKEAADKAEVDFVYFSADLSPKGEAFKYFIMANNLKTVPQVWLDGWYIGGADAFIAHLNGETHVS